jgi:hypothetical protein
MGPMVVDPSSTSLSSAMPGSTASSAANVAAANIFAFMCIFSSFRAMWRSG